MGRHQTGRANYFKGKVSEDLIADAYLRNGFEVVERRWKTPEGEIDLIARHESKIYFIEVKCSRSFESAVEQITPRQQQRIRNAAQQYLAQKSEPFGTECRFDAALVDATGRIKVLPGQLLTA